MTEQEILLDVQTRNPTVGILRLPGFCSADPVECFYIFVEILLDTIEEIEEVFQPEEHFTVGGILFNSISKTVSTDIKNYKY